MGHEVPINLRFLSLNTLSQLCLNNCLYLCGSNKTSSSSKIKRIKTSNSNVDSNSSLSNGNSENIINPISTNPNFSIINSSMNDSEDDNGSFFLKFDVSKSPVSMSYLVNSSHSHRKPSITNYKNEYILIIGGKDCLKCEIFNKKSNKWKDLPDLPEERYASSIISEENSFSIYLFGGYNTSINKNSKSKVKKICNSILRLSLKNSTVWETVVVKENSNYLGRIYSGIFKYDNSSVILVGGYMQNNNSEINDDKNSVLVKLNPNDQIIDFNFSYKTPKLSQFKLFKPSKFTMSQSTEYANAIFLIDDDSKVHKFYKHSYESIMLNFYEPTN